MHSYQSAEMLYALNNTLDKQGADPDNSKNILRHGQIWNIIILNKTAWGPKNAKNTPSMFKNKS